jgi:hypothetical protein
LYFTGSYLLQKYSTPCLVSDPTFFLPVRT